MWSKNAGGREKKCPLTMENISRWTWDVVTDEKTLSDITLVVVNK